MRIFQQQTQIVQNTNGHVHKTFKIVKGNSEKVMKVEGITNKNDPSLYHILQTLRKNNIVQKKYYKIHEDDIAQLLKEGDRKRDIENIKKYVVVKKKKVNNAKSKEVKKVKSKESKKVKSKESKKVKSKESKKVKKEKK
jgi:hypothetical protein